MINKAFEHGFGEEWKDFLISYREGYSTSVSDFHEHEFYEVNLILSGNVNILLKDKMEQGKGEYLVLTSPGTPHYIACQPDVLYKRLYLLISRQFIANYVPEWEQLVALFGKNGNVIKIDNQEAKACEAMIKQIQEETNRFRQRILIFYLLSYLSEMIEESDLNPQKIPKFIMGALSYINEHYDQKIVAETLAEQLYVSRTTLMTAFKKYTGVTLNNYILDFRVKKVVEELSEGRTEQEAAELCGFSDSSTLIRVFKRMYHMTPRQYLKEKHMMEKKENSAQKKNLL